MNLKAIIFDFAGVITTIDPYWTWIEEKFPNLSEDQRTFFQKISNDVDRASITHQQFVDMLANAIEVAPEELWPNILERTEVNQELLGIIKNLKDKYKIGLLSNYTYPWLEELLELYSLSDHFDHIIISSRERLIKPDPKIFYKMLSALNTKAPEAIFFDDKSSNIEGAKRIGIQAFLFTDNDKLKKDLLSVGINYE